MPTMYPAFPRPTSTLPPRDAGALPIRRWRLTSHTLRRLPGDDRLKNVYEANAPIILENHQESSVSSSYNVPLTNDFNVPEMMEQAERIYDVRDTLSPQLRVWTHPQTYGNRRIQIYPCSNVPSTEISVRHMQSPF